MNKKSAIRNPQSAIRNIDVLVFDMDGVLIDIAQSYNQAVIDTVQLYFQRCLGLPGEALLITREDFIDFKYLGGFNDDWDMSYALVEYLLSLIDYRPRNSAFRSPHSTVKDSQAALNILQKAGREIEISLEESSAIRNPQSKIGKAGSEIELSLEELVRRKDIKSLVNRLKGKEVGLAGLRRELKGKNSGLSFCEGEVVGGNLIKRIFQELYLGGEYFKQVYHQSPLIYAGEGYLTKEVRLVKPETMKYLAGRLKLGIATGRPRLDADYALEYFGLKEYFEVVLTQDDVKDRALLKPNPYKLLKVARELGAGEKTRCAYIGDLPDDVIAANRAKSELNFISIGCLAATNDKDSLRQEFEEQGADLIVENVAELAQKLYLLNIGVAEISKAP